LPSPHIVGKVSGEWDPKSASQKACKRGSTISFLLLKVENAIVKQVKNTDFGLRIDRVMKESEKVPRETKTG